MPAEPLTSDTYDALLREARLRIPRYCPEWTDFNPADPGTALVELFAWFTELMLYRLDTVPQRARRELLRLVRLSPRGAEPATAHVALTVSEGTNAPVKVPERARFEASTADGLITFEAVRAVDLVPYKLDAVRVWDGSRADDSTPVNDRGDSSFRPLGWSPQPGNALYLGFAFGANEPPVPAFPTELTLRFFQPARSPFDPTPTSGQRAAPRVTLVWEFQSSDDLPAGTDRKTAAAVDALDAWRRLTVRDDETAKLTVEGTLRLSGPNRSILATNPFGPPDGPRRFWVRCRLVEGEYPADRVPEVGFVRANVVKAEARQTVRGERLGESDGFPSADGFKLRNKPVDPDSLEVYAEAPDGTQQNWERRDDLFNSRPGDRHFTLDAVEGVIRFGDGRQGQVPPPGWVLVARTYRAGGGSNGNVPVGAISAPPMGVPNVEAATNPRPGTGGRDAEKDQDLERRAAQVLRAGDGRAVTADDYRRIAAGVQGVGKAVVRECRHPDHGDCPIPGTLTVVVAPEHTPKPTVADPFVSGIQQDLLDRVWRALNGVRTVGTEVFVAPARFDKVVVKVRVTPADGVTASQAEEGVKRAVELFLAPLPPSADEWKAASDLVPAPMGWEFGAKFLPAQLYPVVLSAVAPNDRRRLVAGWPEQLRVTVNGNELRADEAFTFDADVLPTVVCVAHAEDGP